MIGKIKGKLVELDGNLSLVETGGGVSYEIYLTSSILSSAKVDQSLEVYTYLHIREDAHILYGFQSRNEYKIFKLLISVSGVGPKSAFTVTSFTKEQELLNAIKDNNINFFSQIPGLGKKTAMKIILELSQKLDSEFQMTKMYLSEEDKTVVDALVSLGFKAQQAKTILGKISKKLSVEDKIREALRLVTTTKKV